MQIYKCGGCVRDKLMGVTPSDIDYCVTGATPDEMINLGFLPIEADFPIFLHPSTNDEYALARKERKNSEGGYNGFDVTFDASITLEDDLYRRDLTINAMAEDEHGNIIDPYDGQSDLKYKLIRHVSDHFAEDPVRALRIARFCARWGEEWSVCTATVELIKSMHERGEFSNLTRERIWKELQRAIMEPHAHLFFVKLKDWGILESVFGGEIRGPMKDDEFWEDPLTVLQIACNTNAPLAVRIALSGLNGADLESIKCDTDIVKFTNSLYPAMTSFNRLDRGEDVVGVLNTVNAYQNDKNRNWLMDSIKCVAGPEVGGLMQMWWMVSKDVKFGDLSDDQKQDPPSLFSTHIDNLRAEKIDEFCKDAIDNVKKQSDQVAESD